MAGLEDSVTSIGLKAFGRIVPDGRFPRLESSGDDLRILRRGAA